ncbi:polysaccharide biosynthesis protein [Vibrio stylophorae]
MASDAVFIIFAYICAYYARLGDFAETLSNINIWVCSATAAMTLIAFHCLGLYRTVLRYAGVDLGKLMLAGVLFSAVTITLLSYYFREMLPRTVPIIYSAFLFCLVVSIRVWLRHLHHSLIHSCSKKALIYGAGRCGRQLAAILKQGEMYTPVAYIDDDANLQGKTVQGLKVYSPNQLERMIKKYQLTHVFVALSSGSKNERKVIVRSLMPHKLEVLSIPDINAVATGEIKFDELKDVAIDDLLGRHSVDAHHALLTANIRSLNVMVTGAGGSIGSELCRQIIKQNPQQIVLFELNEFALYQIEKELSAIASCEVISILGSVQDQARLTSVMKHFAIDTLYHAAAYKHVPLVEQNMSQGVLNNLFGTQSCADAAIEAAVKTFVLISTDKAVRPTNAMGASKRMAELVLQAKSAEQSKTRFTMVRFGNVLGSSGSVIPLFKQQIQNGGPITVTHPEIIRYFMTIPEAAQLVIQAGAMGEGGDVFVLDMGEPVKIVDLAKNLVSLSGLDIKDADHPYGDVEIQFTGLRPGEKLYEELLVGEHETTTMHPQIKRAHEPMLALEQLEPLLKNIYLACRCEDSVEIRRLLALAPTGYCADQKIVDWLWQNNIVEIKSARS